MNQFKTISMETIKLVSMCCKTSIHSFNKSLISPNRLNNPDILVRTTVVSLLCRLNPCDATHCRLATSIMKRCIHVYEEVIQGSNNRFANSGVHRCRHRLIQAVLLLQPLITEVWYIRNKIFIQWKLYGSSCNSLLLYPVMIVGIDIGINVEL